MRYEWESTPAISQEVASGNQASDASACSSSQVSLPVVSGQFVSRQLIQSASHIRALAIKLSLSTLGVLECTNLNDPCEAKVKDLTSRDQQERCRSIQPWPI